MGHVNFLCQFRPYLPWICSSLALGYAAYLHWKVCRLKEASKKQQFNKENKSQRDEFDIDDIDRNKPQKRMAFCRCWKSSTWPRCDGTHKYHNKDNSDKVGPLVLSWNEPEPQPEPKAEALLDTSIIEPDMDIKSIDSESPILRGSNGGDSIGEFVQMCKMGDTTTASSDEQLSSLEMIEDNFAAQGRKLDENDDDFDEDTVKVDH